MAWNAQTFFELCERACMCVCVSLRFDDGSILFVIVVAEMEFPVGIMFIVKVS